MESELIHAVINLGIVIALLWISFVLVRKFKLTKQAANKHIKLVNMLSLGTKEKIILLEVNHVFLLIGVTPTHIETLHVFNESERKKFLEQEEKGQRISFSELVEGFKN